MADLIRCGRCGSTQPAPDPIALGNRILRPVAVCPYCLGLIVRDLGELGHPDDRANPGW
jgi:hypothetical protein